MSRGGKLAPEVNRYEDMGPLDARPAVCLLTFACVPQSALRQELEVWKE